MYGFLKDKTEFAITFKMKMPQIHIQILPLMALYH